MPVIRLEFDIDGDVHPELHAMLSAIASPAARGERLRQLAATGLVWERVRIADQPLPAAPVALPTPASAATSGSASAPAAALATFLTAPEAARSTVPVPEMPAPEIDLDVVAPVAAFAAVPVAMPAAAPIARPLPRPGPSDFVDLAIDAPPRLPEPRHEPRPVVLRGEPPGGVPVDPLALPDFEQELESAARELPELFDVLEPSDYPPAIAFATPRAAELPARRIAVAPAATPSPSPVPAPLPLAVAVAARPPSHDAPASIAAEPVDETSAIESGPPQAPARSRLMRMKDRGLFKNE